MLIQQMRRALFVPVLLALTVSAACASAGVGRTAPDFTLKDLLTGEAVKLSSLRGNPVVLDFFATWCGPCNRAFPQLVELYRKYEKQGVKVLAISLEEGPSARVTAWAEKRKSPFPVMHDPGGKALGQLYGIQFFPTYVLLDHQGRVALRSARRRHVTVEDLDRAVAAMLKRNK